MTIPFPFQKQRVKDAKPAGASASHLIRPLSSSVTLAVMTAGCSVLPLLRPAPAPHHYSPATHTVLLSHSWGYGFRENAGSFFEPG